MKRLSLLKTLTAILFYLSLIGMFFAVPALAMFAIMPEKVPLKINGEAANEASPELIISMLFIIIGLGFFTYALFLFKKVLELFEKKKIFHADVIKNLDQTGKAIIIGYAICAVTGFFYRMLTESPVKLNISIGFNESFFILGLGLFFMVLSDVFLMAKTIKDENELTI